MSVNFFPHLFIVLLFLQNSLANQKIIEIFTHNTQNVLSVPEANDLDQLLLSLLGPQKKCSKELIDFKLEQNGNSILHESILLGLTEFSKILLKEKKLRESKNMSNMDPLHYAAWMGRTEILDELLGLGFDPKIKGGLRGSTIYHLSAEEGHYSTLNSLLLKNKENVDLVDSNNKTPLMRAASRGNLKCVEVLLKYNANPCAKDSNGHTAFDIAVKNNRTAVIGLLKCTDRVGRN